MKELYRDIQSLYSRIAQDKKNFGKNLLSAIIWVGGVISVYEVFSGVIGRIYAGILVSVPLIIHIVVSAIKKPDNDHWLSEGDVFQYSVTVPPSFDDYMEVNRLAGLYYGGATPDPDTILAEFARDPYTTVILKQEKDIIGFADYYCFTKENFDAYRAGILRSVDLFEIGSISHPDARHATVIYVSTIHMFGNHDTFRAKLHAQVLRYGLLKCIRDYQVIPSSGLDIYAAAFGEGSYGERILRRLGFSPSQAVIFTGDKIWCRLGVRATEIDAAIAHVSRMALGICNFNYTDTVRRSRLQNKKTA